MSRATICDAEAPAGDAGTSVAGWTLVWSDEFDGPADQKPDAAHWVPETGGNGWGNNELESYTNRTSNVSHNGTALVITAQGNPRTAAGMAAEGIDVHTYAAAEIGINGSGGPTCMTRPILRA